MAEGSATVALRMAEELGHRVRYGAPVTRIRVSPQGCTVTTETGRALRVRRRGVRASRSARCANMRVEGVSDERMRSLDRQRHALAAKVVFTYEDSFWHDQGQNGDAYFETAVIGGTWVQREGIMSTLVPPERLAAFLTTSQAQLEAELTEEMVEAFGERGARHAGGLLPPLGRRPLDARLHHRLAAGRRDVGGPAARHARAALLRLRLGPVGLRLHGGRGSHRAAAPPPPRSGLLT